MSTKASGPMNESIKAKSSVQKFVAKRRERLRRLIKKSGLDGFLVTNIVNVSYLTGFTGSSAYLLMTPETEVLISDFRYVTQIEAECPELKTEFRGPGKTILDSAESVIGSFKCSSLGIEADSMTKATHADLESRVSSILVDTNGWISRLRSVKDRFEIERIRHSIRVNERAFEVIRSQLTPAQTELEIAFNLEHQMRAFGASGVAFDPIVGVGPRAALPHGKPGSTKVGESGFLLLDWGAKVDRYASDLTRIIVTGKITSKLRKIYEIVLKAQLSAIRKLKPGVSIGDVDAAARSVIDKAGYGKYFGHGLGHGFGLEIHENPFMSPQKSDELEQNMVVTVEPGIYIPGWGGVRIEDDILITSDGHEVLSNLPKNLEECVVDIG